MPPRKKTRLPTTTERPDDPQPLAPLSIRTTSLAELHLADARKCQHLADELEGLIGAVTQAARAGIDPKDTKSVVDAGKVVATLGSGIRVVKELREDRTRLLELARQKESEQARLARKDGARGKLAGVLRNAQMVTQQLEDMNDPARAAGAIEVDAEVA